MAAEACSICRIRSLIEPPDDTRLPVDDVDRPLGVFEGGGREEAGFETDRTPVVRGAPFADDLGFEPMTERGIRLVTCGILVS